MKAAIYCRVSTEDQEREGTSIGDRLRLFPSLNLTLRMRDTRNWQSYHRCAMKRLLS